MKSFDVLNQEGKLARTIQAESLADAKSKAEAIIKKDGSYRAVDGWDAVQCPVTRKRLYLGK